MEWEEGSIFGESWVHNLPSSSRQVAWWVKEEVIEVLSED